MKILIIALPRTGSTSLLKKISQEQKLNLISEPFNDINGNLQKYKDFNWGDVNDICVKTHINHKDISFYLEFIKFFDEIILLSRKDLTECAESLAYANYFENFVENYKWVQTPNLNKNIELVGKFNDELIKLSKMINVHITYYEDIFDINSKDRLRKHYIKRENLV
jgi:hypothetical protein